jgi:methyl-accepting chemotaxis protein
VRKAVEAMNNIEKSSGQIGQIIGVIDEIAFQTNLLALNAGVEAARAGDAGRGFAVVASEVRALAQRSAEAAKEIKTLINASRGQVEEGVDLVGQTGTALTRIVEQVSEINNIVTSIAGSAQEQSSALAEINSAINQMDRMTQQNAAMVEESTAATHGLGEQTAELFKLMAGFRVAAENGMAKQQTTANPARAPAASPKPVPAMKTVGRGGAALKPKEDGWEEF